MRSLTVAATILIAGAIALSAPSAQASHKNGASHDMTGGQGMMNMDETDMSTMRTGLLMPLMNPARGRKVFGAKGCVICHRINGVGGGDAPSLDMSRMGPMNPFAFVAKMWRGAEAMIAMQEDELGAQIELTGQDLADIIAFVHSPTEVAKFSRDDVSHEMLDILDRAEDE